MESVGFQVKYRVFQYPNFFGTIYSYTRFLYTPLISPILGAGLLRLLGVPDAMILKILATAFVILSIIWRLTWKKGIITLQQKFQINDKRLFEVSFSEEMKLSEIEKVTSFPASTSQFEISTRKYDIQVWDKSKNINEVKNSLEEFIRAHK